MTKPINIFIHIPKTGGTTITDMIKAHCGPEETWRTAPSGLVEGHNFVMGHTWYGVHETHYPGAIPAYFTVLRDPVERLWSVYWMTMRGLPVALEHGAAQCLRACNAHCDLDNTMTRMISGIGYAAGPKTPLTAADLERARANLRRFVAVGLFEPLELSVQLLYHTFGWIPDPLVHRNQDASKPQQIPDDARAVMEGFTVLDRQLYAYGRGLFEAHIKRMGEYEWMNH